MLSLAYCRFLFLLRAHGVRSIEEYIFEVKKLHPGTSHERDYYKARLYLSGDAATLNLTSLQRRLLIDVLVTEEAPRLDLATQEYYYDYLYRDRPLSYIPSAEHVASTMRAVKLGQLYPASLRLTYKE